MLAQHLVQGNPAMLEPHGAAGQVQPIGAQRPRALFAPEYLRGLRQARLERIAPGPQRARVVRPQILTSTSSRPPLVMASMTTLMWVSSPPGKMYFSMNSPMPLPSSAL